LFAWVEFCGSSPALPKCGKQFQPPVQSPTEHRGYSNLDQSKSPAGEIGRGYVKRPSFVLGQQSAQDVSQTAGLVIDNVGDFHASTPRHL